MCMSGAQRVEYCNCESTVYGQQMGSKWKKEG